MFRTTAAILLFSTVALPAWASSDDLKSESPMTRPPGAPDGDAKGKVKVEHKVDKNRHKLTIEAEHIDTSLTFEAWLEDANGMVQMVGIMQVHDSDEVEIEFDSDEGPALPFGASTVQELEGRSVEVRSGGQTYLEGTVPSLDGSSGSGSGSGSNGGGSGWIKIKQALVRPPTSPDSDVTGYVEVRYRDSDNDQKFKVEAEHIVPSIGFSVYLETGVGTGTLQSVGMMQTEDANEIELELETEDGDSLPFGVAHVSELAGRRVEVRDGSNAVYLTGFVPDIDGSLKNEKSTASLAASSPSSGKAQLKLTKKTKKGDHRFELNIAKVEGSLPLQVWVFNPGSSSFEMVADIVTKKNGKKNYKVSTKKGEALPLNVATLEEIGGLQIEVRMLDGTVRFNGQVPQL